MAYKVGQLRKITQNYDYLNKIPLQRVANYKSSDVLKSNLNIINAQQRFFQNLSLKMNNDTSFSISEVYYIRFKILQVPIGYYSVERATANGVPVSDDYDNLRIQLQLAKQSQSEMQNSQNPQKIGDIVVPKVPKTEENSVPHYLTYSFVFKPKDNGYDRIVFKLQRDTYDYLANNEKESIVGSENPQNKAAYKMWLLYNSITIGEESYPPVIFYTSDSNVAQSSDFGTLRNIIPNGQQEWLKFGFQSRPGSEIVVNGQSIRIGRSGIYEINNGTKIKSFRIAAPKGQVDPFLLDYAYNDITS